MDRAWWRIHGAEVAQDFKGERWSTVKGLDGVRYISRSQLGAPGNSGAGTILLASHFGVERIILIGFDCHKRGGTHWHGNHPKGLGNAYSLPKWPRQFQDVAQRIRAEVVNCSPGSALMVFPRGELDEVLLPGRTAGLAPGGDLGRQARRA
jgi:hypothetical protein